MGAALRVSRNNPEPNTKMVALRMAAGTLCIQLRDVIGEIAPSTAGAGGCCAGAVINAGYVIRRCVETYETRSIVFSIIFVVGKRR
jgi:hypothetical protein